MDDPDAADAMTEAREDMPRRRHQRPDAARAGTGWRGWPRPTSSAATSSRCKPTASACMTRWHSAPT